MKKIEKLTPEQEALLPAFVDYGLQYGLNTSPCDRPKAEAAIRAHYAALNRPEPKLIIWLDSPHQGAIGAAMLAGTKFSGAQVRAQVWAQVWNQVRDQVGDQVYRAAYGAQDMGWVAWFRAMQAIGVNLPKSADTIAAVSENVGWWWPFENAVIVTERPCVIKFDGEKRLHCETGPAVEYRDGFGVYAWRGIRIPPEWIKDGPPDAISCLRVENIEQRRIACEMRGWHNILPKLPNAKLIDKHSNPQVGELWQGDLPDHGKERFLQVKCGTGRRFVIPVGMEFSTAREANAATYGIAPQILDQLEVRT